MRLVTGQSDTTRRYEMPGLPGRQNHPRFQFLRYGYLHESVEIREKVQQIYRT